ncbi:MAG: arsenate reductase ArsC [Deltaproteobacteria bacterium]|nr:MAG: arsenate reductase ArsC [Deltaproteobacteria bacterium]
MSVKSRPRILFLCTGNSCRSQMAQGFARHLKSDEIEAHSAGVAPKGVDPRAIEAMAEAGVDISNQSSKSLDEISQVEFDYVVTLCDNAQRTCPSFPGKKTKVVHVGFEDPPKLAATATGEEEIMGHYRRIRDKIRAFVEQLPKPLVRAPDDPLGHKSSFQSGMKAFLDQHSSELPGKKED